MTAAPHALDWHDIRGHEAIEERFRRMVARGRLAGSFLFVGPAGVGKHTFARRLATVLLCEQRAPTELEACGQCPGCRLAVDGSHPDLLQVARPADKSFIPVELLIGDRERRMREGLCHDIGLKPFRGGLRVAIIDDADYLNPEGANCLLKTLEEPPPSSVLILIGTTEHQQLPTIRSRCQVMRFQPLAHDDVRAILLERGLAETPAQAEEWARHSGGSVRDAVVRGREGLADLRRTLVPRLGEVHLDGLALAKEVAALVDQAGKEAPQKRIVLREVCRIAIDGLREHLSAAVGETGNVEVQTLLADRLERCFDVLIEIDCNANVATLIECWCDDLARPDPRRPFARPRTLLRPR